MKIRKQYLVAAAVAGALAITSAYAQKPAAGGPPTPGFNTKIPPSIMTPDTVETRIGTLKFVDGVPTHETTQKLYDHLDFLRGVEAFLTFVPAAPSKQCGAAPPKWARPVVIKRSSSTNCSIPIRCS